MRQTNLYEFLNDYAEAERQELFKETGTEDNSETKCDCCGTKLDFEEAVKHIRKPAEPPIMEKVITTFLEHCAARAALPSREEAEVIYLLDNILTKHNA